MSHKDYIIVKDRHPRISEVLNDCVNLCVPSYKNEPLSSILQKFCGKLTEAIADIAALETEVDELQADPCPPISADTGNIIECRTDGIFAEVELPPSLRFGVSGEDDTQAEDRDFIGSNAFHFNLTGVSELHMGSTDGRFIASGSGITLIDDSGQGRYQIHTMEAATATNIVYYNPVSHRISRGLTSDLATTASQGLTKTGSDIQIGGTITGTRSIALSSFGNISMTCSQNTVPFNITQGGNGAAAFFWNQGGGNACSAQGTNGNAFTGNSANVTCYMTSTPAATTGAQNVLRLDRLCVGTATDQIGCAIAMYTETSNTSAQLCGLINANMTTVNTATRTSRLEFHAVSSTAQQIIMMLAGGGAVTLPQGLGNFIDDAAAAVGGVAVNQLYRNGSVVQIRVA